MGGIKMVIWDWVFTRFKVMDLAAYLYFGYVE